MRIFSVNNTQKSSRFTQMISIMRFRVPFPAGLNYELKCCLMKTQISITGTWLWFALLWVKFWTKFSFSCAHAHKHKHIHTCVYFIKPSSGHRSWLYHLLYNCYPPPIQSTLLASQIFQCFYSLLHRLFLSSSSSFEILNLYT